MTGHIQRRDFLRTGFAAVGAFMLTPSNRRLWNLPQDFGNRARWTPIAQSCPILPIPSVTTSTIIDGLPFAPTWFGDSFASGGFPFHSPESPPRWAQLDEHVDVAVIGGGLSGLATAHALRNRNWVLFDLRTRFGGSAMGESWNRLQYSLGSAYFMVPDKGSDLDRLYDSLGVYAHAQVDTGAGFRFEFGGEILDDICENCTPEEIVALKKYGAAVQDFANKNYPEIPWTDDATREFVRQLDTQNFHESVDAICGGTTPPMLARALEAYCFSSFGVGWDELSAAAGWNFIAAEEFGRLVMPGGNAGLATLFWKELAGIPCKSPDRPRLRAGCIVTNIRMEAQGVSLAWRDLTGKTHTLGAKQVVYAGSKHILKHMMPELSTLDPEKYEATNQVLSVPYLVVNVLLTRRVHEKFYDIFTIHDEQFPMSANDFEQDRRITDAVNGTFAVATPHPNGDILTLYWPLPWHTARFSIISDESVLTYAALAAPQIKRILEVLSVTDSDVASIRMTRWGHAMPYARPGTYSGDLCDVLRRPMNDRIWFANQDNWLLPAVETCLQEAMWVAKNMPA